MGCYSETAKYLASLYAARKLRKREIESRISVLNSALLEAEADEQATADALMAETEAKSHDYLVGTHVVRVSHGMKNPGVTLSSPTVAPVEQILQPLKAVLPENESDLPKRAIMLVGAK